MDRPSLAALRHTPGYLRFVGAATLARVADEMFSVGVVLLTLQRTGSASLAGGVVAAITGPALAGTICAVWSPSASLLTEAVLTLLAGFLILGLRSLDRAPTRRAEALWQVARDGLRQIVVEPALRAASIAGSLGLLGVGFLTVTFPFFCTDALGVGPSHAGHLWGAFALGSTVGALGLVRLQRRWPSERIVLVALAIFGLLMTTWPLAHSLLAALALVAIAGVADGPGLAA